MGKIGKIWLLNLVCLGVFVFNYCRPVKSTRDSFQNTRFCYDAGSSKLDKLIRIKNGYYSFYKTYTKNNSDPDKSRISSYQINCTFFDDGMFIYYFNPDISDGMWGKYIIDDNLIKARYIEPPGGMSWSKNDIWFKIINKNTIEEINGDRKFSDAKINTSQGHFIEYSNLPNPDKSWLKRRKWFWCDENEYYTWKAEIKKKDKWKKWRKN